MRSAIGIRAAPLTRTVALLGASAILAVAVPAGLAVAAGLGELAPPDRILTEVATRPVVYGYAALAGFLLFVQRHVAQRREARLRELALSDPLTCLKNRRHFEQRLAEERARARRHGMPLSVLLIDIDGLKPINDELGHGAGDRAILAVARALGTGLRGTDVAARLGGDEFAVLCLHTTAADARTVAERIREGVRQLGRGELAGRLSVSIGVADLEAADRAGVDVLSAADRALYQAKASCRGVELAIPEGPCGAARGSSRQVLASAVGP